MHKRKYRKETKVKLLQKRLENATERLKVFYKSK